MKENTVVKQEVINEEATVEGWLELRKPGWLWNSWEKRWWVIRHHHMYAFSSDQSPQALDQISLRAITKSYAPNVEKPSAEEKRSFYIETDKTNRPLLYFRTPDPTMREAWLFALRRFYPALRYSITLWIFLTLDIKS